MEYFALSLTSYDLIVHLYDKYTPELYLEIQYLFGIT